MRSYAEIFYPTQRSANNFMKELIDAINTSRSALLSATKTSKSPEFATALQFWTKILENCEAVTLLLSHNLNVQAFAVHRISIEHLANFAALLKGLCTVEQLKKKSEADIVKQARLLSEGEDKSPVLTDENKNALAGLRDRLTTKEDEEKSQNTFNLLAECGLSCLYVEYRIISLGAAHSTLVSIIQSSSTEEIDKVKKSVVNLLKFPTALLGEFMEKR